jgi:hypothetical protein
MPFLRKVDSEICIIGRTCQPILIRITKDIGCISMKTAMAAKHCDAGATLSRSSISMAGNKAVGKHSTKCHLAHLQCWKGNTFRT